MSIKFKGVEPNFLKLVITSGDSEFRMDSDEKKKNVYRVNC